MAKWNPGWEELGAWVDTLDLSGPTPGLLRIESHGNSARVVPTSFEELSIRADRERLIDDFRD